MKEIKAFTAILACLCLFFVIGCSGSDSNTTDDSATTTEDEAVETTEDGEAPPMPVGGGG